MSTVRYPGRKLTNKMTAVLFFLNLLHDLKDEEKFLEAFDRHEYKVGTRNRSLGVHKIVCYQVDRVQRFFAKYLNNNGFFYDAEQGWRSQ